ncbi:g8898 [Coccomyxa viridis]|uniref:G8898 protein n=1 Tax=Coccomyxa viridis TaxID=1274662 RepID=A0ABP1G5Z9_9CHLO
MHLTPVTEASPEQQAFLALLARGGPRLPHICVCHRDPWWTPTSCCHCESPDPWDDWDRSDVIWASLASSNVIYCVLNTPRLFALRVFHSDCDALLDALVYRLLERDYTAVAAMVDRPPWPTSKLRLQPCGPICGRDFTAAVIHRKARPEQIAASATLYVRLGLSPYSPPDPISWHPHTVPITLQLSGTFLFIDLPPIPFLVDRGRHDHCLHLRWGDHDLLDCSHYVRPCKFPTYAVQARQLLIAGSHIDHLCEWPEDPITWTRPPVPDLLLVTLQAIPLLDRQAPRAIYLDELHPLRHALTFLLTRARRAAYTIQRRWRRAICDPQFALARRRLYREFAALDPL